MDELEVKSLALDKLHFKSLAFKDTWNPYKILVSLSLRDRVKCGVLGGKGEVNSLALDRHIYQKLGVDGGGEKAF